jgi:hypothetical protein
VGDRSDKRTPDPGAALRRKGEPEALQRADEPPVVARLIIEVRSDGTRTVARGAMEDLVQGQRVAIEARGSTPFDLALSLAGALVKLPSLARSSLGALRLLGGRKK